MITILSVIIAGCADSKKNKIVYEIEGVEFVLNKGCVAEISPIEAGVGNVPLVNIKLKNNDSCSKQLNLLISENIGGKLSSYYNYELISQANIAGSLSTENGYRQRLLNKTMLEDVLTAYGK